jgi:hypothetical protein
LNKAISEDDNYQTEDDDFTLLCENIDQINENNVPSNYYDAINSTDKEKWKKSIAEEFDSLIKNNTWKLVDRSEVPKGAKIISSRWIFKIKNETNNKTRYKSRLVAKGFADNNKYDLTETYAPVSKITDVRLFLSIANKFDLDIDQMDVKTAFLNGLIIKDVFLLIPDGYECDDQTRKCKVLKLNKALYGLKISPRRWYERFRERLIKMGFSVYPFNSCIFIWKKGNTIVIIILYVDDILILGNNRDKINETKRKLNEEFEMTDLGSPSKFLGITITRDRKNKVIYLTQTDYLNSILKRFNFDDCKPTRTPMRTIECQKKVELQR